MTSSKEYMRAWRAKNKDHHKAYCKKYYQDHREQQKEWWSKHYQENKEAILARNKKAEQSKPEKYLLSKAKKRAREIGKEFNLELTDIIIPEYCPILNIKLGSVRSSSQDINASPSIDRIDNSKGYIKGNVAIISRRANSAKSDLSLEDIKRLYEYSLRG